MSCWKIFILIYGRIFLAQTPRPVAVGGKLLRLAGVQTKCRGIFRMERERARRLGEKVRHQEIYDDAVPYYTDDLAKHGGPLK